MLSEGRRIEDDQVIFALGHTLQVVKGILRDGVVAGTICTEVQSHVLLGEVHRLGRAIQ